VFAGNFVASMQNAREFAIRRAREIIGYVIVLFAISKNNNHNEEENDEAG
jgi:hypothetical protein